MRKRRKEAWSGSTCSPFRSRLERWLLRSWRWPERRRWHSCSAGFRNCRARGSCGKVARILPAGHLRRRSRSDTVSLRPFERACAVALDHPGLAGGRRRLGIVDRGLRGSTSAILPIMSELRLAGRGRRNADVDVFFGLRLRLWCGAQQRDRAPDCAGLDDWQPQGDRDEGRLGADNVATDSRVQDRPEEKREGEKLTQAGPKIAEEG